MIAALLLATVALANNPIPIDSGLFPGDTGFFFPCTGDTGLGGPIDADDDGFDSTVDCDDTDPDNNPDAREVCLDEVDNDCDELIDESQCWPGRKPCRTGCERDQAWLVLLPLVMVLRRRR